MNIIITAGGTSERIDEVRKISNMATGRLGSLIANEFIQRYSKRSDVVHICYICSENTIIPDVSFCKKGDIIDVIKITTVNDLQNTITSLMAKHKFDAVIHTMAVSDYTARNVMDAGEFANFIAEEILQEKLSDDSLTLENRGYLVKLINEAVLGSGRDALKQKKISSDINNLLIFMDKTPKIIKLIKQLQPETILVGFKLLVDVGEDELLQAAYNLILKNNCDFVLANDLEKINNDVHVGYFVKNDKSYEKLNTKQEIADKIVTAVTGYSYNMDNRKDKMTVGFIGAGKVGFSLGKYLKENGATISGYYSRNPESAYEASRFTDSAEFDSIGELSSNSDILFITVPDDTIKIIWDQLRELDIKDKIICHCSGSLSSEIFKDIEQKGAFGYSLHPLFAIDSKSESYKKLHTALFTIEGDNKHIGFLKGLIEKMGNKVHIINKEQKTKYHAASVYLSNLVTALANVGVTLLEECGFNEEFTKNVLNTLFINNCVSTAHYGPIQALTGPVERNDILTVKKHIECLDEKYKSLYTLLSGEIVEMAKIKHNNYDYSEMEKILKKGKV